MSVPEPRFQNSAGRLLAFLTAMPNGQTYLDTIPGLFDIPTPDKQHKQQASIQGLVQLNGLYLEFVEDMQSSASSPEQKEVVLRGLEKIRESIYPIQLNAHVRPPTEAERALLEVAATMLPQDGVLSKNDIEEIRASIASLRELVEKADIPSSIRKVLLDLIRLSDDALSRFNIHGARGLRRAFKAMLAEAAEAYGVAAIEGKQEELKKSGIWAAVVNHLKTFDAVASRLLKYQPLLGKVSQWLLGGPSNEPPQ